MKAVFTSVALMSVLGVSGVASAAAPTWSIDPSTGSAGTVISVTGTCPVDEINGWEAVGLYLGDVGGDVVQQRLEPITPGVEWSFTLTVPDPADPGDWSVGKQCARLDDQGMFDGGEGTERMPFVVTVVTTTTTTPTTTTTTPVTTTTTPVTTTTTPVTTTPVTTTPVTTTPVTTTVPPSTTTPPGSGVVLPETGSSDGMLAVIAALLVMAGGLALLMSRRLGST